MIIGGKRDGTKNKIQSFLDFQEVGDYLATVHLVSMHFRMSLDDSEGYVRKWYGDDSEFGLFYQLMKKLSQLYAKDLSEYETSRAFWTDIAKHLDQTSLEVLLLLPSSVWIEDVREILVQQQGLGQ